MVSKADEYRKNVEECRRQAAKTINDKADWLKLAKCWLRMAQEVDRAHGRER
jgi:hypothetical protein